jgi:hypothetical protein
MTVNTQAEADFFIKHLKPEHRVLEWGSGASTLEIAKHVKQIFSIENNLTWFGKIVGKVPDNAKVFYVPFNTEEGPGEDGSYEQYKDYVDAGIDLANNYGKFDVIFIDGRARVACAAICEQIGHKDTLVFIHDYNHPNPKYLRSEYFPAEDHLNRLDGELTMWKFNIKAFDKDREDAFTVTITNNTDTPVGSVFGGIGTDVKINPDNPETEISKKKVKSDNSSEKSSKPAKKSVMKQLASNILHKTNKKLGKPKPKKK